MDTESIKNKFIIGIVLANIRMRLSFALFIGSFKSLVSRLKPLRRFFLCPF